MTNRAVAARYARALFEVSRDSGDVEKTEQDILLFQQLLNDHDTLRKVLFNPAISVLDKRGLVQAVLSKMLLSAVAERLLLMLADRDRLELLPEVSEIYNVFLMDHLGIVRARITTAVPLESSHVESMVEALASATGRKIKIETSVDDTLVGGMMTQIGSTVFDGSIAHHLDRLRQRFITGT
tara:strand:- start:176 stop:721 length:546 start_codon:yes stop_codon:yes gene_type:complete